MQEHFEMLIEKRRGRWCAQRMSGGGAIGTCSINPLYDAADVCDTILCEEFGDYEIFNVSEISTSSGTAILAYVEIY